MKTSFFSNTGNLSRAFPSLLLASLLATTPSNAAPPTPPPTPIIEYIDTSFENASPVWYEFDHDNIVNVHLKYDHERSSPNRAAGHFHFRVQATKGQKVTLEFKNLDNIWNGRFGSVARELKQVVVSEDGKYWSAVPTETLEKKRTRVTLNMTSDALFVARVEPYRLSDLNRFLDEIKSHPLIKINTIGKTFQGRDLEIIRLGNEKAPHHVFLRARSHPWETAGNWVVEGLVRRLLKDDPEAKKFLANYCVSILPMTNKDGVERGGTRFSVGGKDLNRQWDKPADPTYAPENVALERWLEAEIQAGRRPILALDFHNDGNGQIHLSRPEGKVGEEYLARMEIFEQCLRDHTWFTEGSSKPSFRNPGSFGEGLFERYGITAAILEFNCNYIAGLKQPALGKHWFKFGEDFAKALDAYLAVTAK